MESEDVTLPELQAMQAVYDVLRPFTGAERERILRVATALHGSTLLQGWVPTHPAARAVLDPDVLDQALRAARRRSA